MSDPDLVELDAASNNLIRLAEIIECHPTMHVTVKSIHRAKTMALTHGAAAGEAWSDSALADWFDNEFRPGVTRSDTMADIAGVCRHGAAVVDSALASTDHDLFLPITMPPHRCLTAELPVLPYPATMTPSRVTVWNGKLGWFKVGYTCPRCRSFELFAVDSAYADGAIKGGCAFGAVPTHGKPEWTRTTVAAAIEQAVDSAWMDQALATLTDTEGLR